LTVAEAPSWVDVVGWVVSSSLHAEANRANTATSATTRRDVRRPTLLM
jgi:hypothetical protein